MRFEYDSRFQCWVLRRYADVHAALKDPQRFAYTQQAGFDERGHTQTLRAAMERFRLPIWLAALNEIPIAEAASELVSEWVEPWCHAAALELVAIKGDPGGRLLTLARKAFAAGALVDAPPADKESQALDAMLPPVLGPLTVQAFVAVSQTLTAFLANAVCVLLENHAVYPHTSRALEELLRFAGPSQALFRYLSEPVGDLAKGTRIALLVGEANRDLNPFPDPHKLDFKRNAAGHLAFGYGLHACVGAALIRAAAPVALLHLTRMLEASELVSIEWPAEPRVIRSPLAIRIRELSGDKMRYQK